MKAYNAVYKYGHLYDSETGKRILLADNSKFSVTVNAEDVLAVDPYNHEFELRDPDSIIASLKEKKYKEASKVLPAGSKIFFDISAGSKGKKTERLFCNFQVQLLEDLFIARKEAGGKYNIMECHCVVEQCLSGNLNFFEPIYSYSVNNAYMKTYDFYFRLFGSPTVNARDEVRDKLNGKPGFLSVLCDAKNSPQIVF
jgi:hypothetical protein